MDAGRLGTVGKFAGCPRHHQRRNGFGRKISATSPALRRSAKRRQATRVVHYQVQQQGLNLCNAFGFQGSLTTISNACASGANAIGHAWEMIRSGRAEKVLTGGYDALCQLTFAGFDSLQALSPTPCRPFDARRDGLTLGEGAAILTLGNARTARKARRGNSWRNHRLRRDHRHASSHAAASRRQSRPGRDDRRVRRTPTFHRRRLITSTPTARPRRTTMRPKPPPSTSGRVNTQKIWPSVPPSRASAICLARRARLKRLFA